MRYADDVPLISGEVTRRLTAIADAVRDNTDMNVSMPKTFTHHVANKCDKLKVSADEPKTSEQRYKFKYDFCPRRFKTEKTCRYIYTATSTSNYDTIQEVFEVEKVVGAFAHVENRWILVKW